MIDKDVLIAEIERIKSISKLITVPKMGQEVEKGFRSSKLASVQPQEVAMTPYFKNLLKRMDKEYNQENKRLMVDDKPTRAEKFVYDFCVKVLNRYFGPKQEEYDRDENILSFAHYIVDNWRNLKENMRDIQPGQAEQRVAMSKKYATTPKKIVDIEKLLSDRVFLKAVDVVLEHIPSVRMSDHIYEINLPFMTKHTNVGPPFWRNDKAKIDPQDAVAYKWCKILGKDPNSLTYGQLTMDMANHLNFKWDELKNFNISTMFGRNQRGKGRFLVAVARVLNLVLNQLEGEEIQAYKEKSPLFAGYRDDTELKKVLIHMAEFCERNGLKADNRDQRNYDVHVSPEFLLLLGAMSTVKANGAKSKEIARWRAAFMLKTWLVNGLTSEVQEIFGRIFSGFIDTNRGGGLINAVVTTATMMRQDPDYTKIIYKIFYWMLVMGDDNLFVYKDLDVKRFIKDMDSLGFEVHPDKGEFGIFFLQNRLFRDKEGKYVMVYPWTRVLKSALFKETGKGLGPAGWLMSTYQQLFKLIEFPLALKILVNFLYPLDDLKLGIEMTPDQIKTMIKQEDQEAKTRTDGKTRNSFESTATKLYDGDPTKARQFTQSADGTVEFSEEYISIIHQAVKDAYDPNFLSDLGVAVPK